MDQNFINVVKNHLDNLRILSIKKYCSNTHMLVAILIITIVILIKLDEKTSLEENLHSSHKKSNIVPL